MARVIKAEYCLGQVKDDRVQNYKARIEEQNRDKNSYKKYQGGNNNNRARHQGNSQAQTRNNNKKRGKPNENQASNNRRRAMVDLPRYAKTMEITITVNFVRGRQHVCLAGKVGTSSRIDQT